MTCQSSSELAAAAGSGSTGKRRALLALALLLPAPVVGTAAPMLWWPGTWVGQTVFVACKLWVTVLPVFWLLRIERGRLSWSPPRQGGFGTAAVLGLAIAAAIVAAYELSRRLGWLDAAQVAERARQTGLAHRGVYLLGALYWIGVNSLLEEYVWRWFCLRQCERLFGGRVAVVLAAAGFTLHHVVALAAQFSWLVTVVGSGGVFVGGVLWGWLYLRYRSVWPCYVSHAIADVPIFLLGYQLIFGPP